MTTKALCLALVSALVLAGLVSGPAPAMAQEEEHIFESTNFSIRWVEDAGGADTPDLTDDDANGVPDGIERMVGAFESARAFELVDLGYKPPPVEGRYELFVADLGGLRAETRALPGDSGSRGSFILISPSMVRSVTDDASMRVLAAHEFHHAIQHGYDTDEPSWIKEATSAYIEGVFAPDVLSNRFYLTSFMLDPRIPLDALDGQHEYGAFVFLQFLVERFHDPSLVRELWEEMAVPEAIPGAANNDDTGALEAVLERRGSTLAGAWGEFLMWARRPATHFNSGEAYREVLTNFQWPTVLRKSEVRSETCRLTSDAEDDEELEALSGDYVTLTPHPRAPESSRAHLAVEGPPGATGFYVLKARSGPFEEHSLEFSEGGVAEANFVFGSAQVKKLTVGLGNGATESRATLAYSLRLRGRARVIATPPVGSTATTFGTGVSLSGSVACRNEPAPFADVVVTETELISGAVREFLTETNEFGRWGLGVTPQANSSYSAEVVDPLVSSASSTSHDVAVQVAVTIELASSQVTEGSPVIVAGDVFPSHPGIGVVVEYRRPEGEWITGAAVVTDAASHYDAQFVLPAPGVWEIRSRVESTGDQDHEPGISGTRLVDVLAP